MLLHEIESESATLPSLLGSLGAFNKPSRNQLDWDGSSLVKLVEKERRNGISKRFKYAGAIDVSKRYPKSGSLDDCALLRSVGE